MGRYLHKCRITITIIFNPVLDNSAPSLNSLFPWTIPLILERSSSIRTASLVLKKRVHLKFIDIRYSI